MALANDTFVHGCDIFVNVHTPPSLFPSTPTNHCSSSTFELPDLSVVVAWFCSFLEVVCVIGVVYRNMGEGLLQEGVALAVLTPPNRASPPHSSY